MATTETETVVAAMETLTEKEVPVLVRGKEEAAVSAAAEAMVMATAIT